MPRWRDYKSRRRWRAAARWRSHDNRRLGVRLVRRVEVHRRSASARGSRRHKFEVVNREPVPLCRVTLSMTLLSKAFRTASLPVTVRGSMLPPPSVPCAKATPLHRIAAMLRALPASIRSRPRRRVAILLLLSVATSESSCPAGAESAQGWCAPYPRVRVRMVSTIP